MDRETPAAAEALADALIRALSAEDAHVDPVRALAGLDADLAGRVPWAGLAPAAGRPSLDAPYSIYQLLRHLVYWQDLLLRALRGEPVAWPRTAAEGWRAPQRPPSEAAWREAVARFLAGLREAQQRARELAGRPEDPLLRHVLVLALHNSYHLGQIVLLRRMLDAWPPPGGGDTW